MIHFGPAAVLVPFAAPWRPVAVAAGVIAGWLALMLAVSFRLRRYIGQRVWRRLHYASFAAFVLALVHALTSGTDLAGVGGPMLALAAGLPVLWLTLVRILLPAHRRPAAAEPPLHDLKELLMAYRIIIDRDVCSGFGACVDLDPETFAVGDDGIAVVLVDRPTPRPPWRPPAPARWGRSA